MLAEKRMVDGPIILALGIDEPNAIEAILAAVITDSSLVADLMTSFTCVGPELLQDNHAKRRDGLLHFPANRSAALSGSEDGVESGTGMVGNGRMATSAPPRW